VSAGSIKALSCYRTPMLLQLQPLRYFPVDKGGISTRVKQCQCSEVCGRVAHGYEALTIGAVDISSSAAAGQVSDATSETGRTCVSSEVDIATTLSTSVVLVIIGHSTDFSSMVQYVLSKIIAAYDYW
jgi:hypothetical protein